MNTVFITGASSGIGRETAKVFQSKGWNVIATMRNPEREKELIGMKNVEVLQCDVTDAVGRSKAIEEAIKKFGKIDVLVNNAGFYTVGPLEATTSEQIERQINTNLLGLIEMTKAILPHFRVNKQGVIVNLSSIAGKVSIPLQSLYHATKYGVEGFSESLQYEVAPYHIKIKVIEPGTIKTEFCGRSMTISAYDKVEEYQEYTKRMVDNLIKNGNQGADPKVVAKTIYKASTTRSNKMRYTVGKMTSMIFLHRILPLRLYQKMIQFILGIL